MKSKIVRGKSFKGCLAYVLRKKVDEKEKPEIISTNLASDKENEMLKEFHAIRSERNDIEKPVWHTSLSLPTGDKLSDQEWKNVAEDYLKKMGFDLNNNQYLIVRHKDTDKDHVHIIANRVGIDGKVWLGQHEAYQSIDVCQQLEKDHHLSRTRGLRGSKKAISMPSKNEIELALRTGEKPARMVLQAALETAMADKGDLQSFTSRLQAVGIEPLFNVSGTGHVSGVSFSVNNIAFKGSQLGKKFSWNTIKEVVEYDKNRDFGIIEAFSNRRKNEQDGSGRIPVKSNGNDDFSISRDDRNSIRIDVGSSNKKSEIIDNSKSYFRESARNNIKARAAFNTAGYNFKRTVKKITEIHSRFKKKDRERNESEYYKDSVNSWNNKSFSSPIGRIFDHTETIAKSANKFRQQGSGYNNSSAAKIKALRERLGLIDKEEVKEDIKTYNKPAYIVEHEKEQFKSKLQKTKNLIGKKASEKEEENENNKRKRLKI